ncbi:MAG: topoisomerase [Chthoniobacter sp.]|nr:topoisomerase [Chthoniobacter sp.]
MGKTLVIAEKPSVAADLARVLGVKKTDDFFENADYVISSAVGHLLELSVPEEHEIKRGKWTMEKLPHLPPEFALAPIEKNAGRLSLLKRLIKRKDVDALINACDAGREGELIFRNLIKASGAKKTVRRLWLQSMTPESIRTAFTQLRSDEEMLPLADAAVSRSESDWLVGINSTRALTAFNSQGGGFTKTTAGRVQTPTLAILVEREEKIRAFKERAMFEVFGQFEVKAGEYAGRWFDDVFKKQETESARTERLMRRFGLQLPEAQARLQSGHGTLDDEHRYAHRLWHEQIARAIETKCKGKKGVIEEEKKPSTQAPPLLYDLTTLQREANSRHGFPAKMTLQVAQALYEKHKALTYPRTDSRYLPEDHLATARKVMGSFSDPSLSVHAGKALKEGVVAFNKRIFNNAKVSDHFAIVPTGADPKSLSETEAKIFDLVARRFIAVFYPPAEFETTTRITTVETEKFKTEAKIIVKPGWLAVYGRKAGTDEGSDKAIALVEAGESATTREVEVKESLTKPPARYTEATLLSAMEGAGKLVDDEDLREAMRERGLGTPATRAQVIEGLLFEGYLVRQGRDLIVTAKGISLITLLRNLHAEALTKPELTGEWESKLREMERGKLSRDEFMQQIRALTTEIVEKVRGGMGQEVTGNFRPIEVTCPKCGGGPFKESFKAYECVNPECKLIVWKNMSGRELEREEVEKLLTEKRIGPLEGFRSKMGRAFSAIVKLEKNEDGELKQSFEFEGDAQAGTAVDLTAATPVASCPVCKKGTVYETESSFLCENAAGAAKTCDLRIGKVILQKHLPTAQVAKLLTTGKTDLISGFVSKKGKGKSFAAHLTLDAKGKIGWEFAPRVKKPPKAPAVKAAA